MKKTLAVLFAALLLLALCTWGSARQSSTAPPVYGAGAAPEAEIEPAEEIPAPETEATVQPDPEPEPGPGDYTPDFTFSTTDRDGKPWDESVFRGYTLTMLNFWEPWCGPCVREMPGLQKLAEKYAEQGFQILGIYSTGGMEEDVDIVLRDTGVQYPVLHYTKDFSAFLSGYVPTTVFVDGEGHIVGGRLYVGSRSFEGWETLIVEMLA